MSDTSSPITSRPQSVGRFELLAWLSLALIVCDIIAYVFLYPGVLFSETDDAPITLLEGAAGIYLIVSFLIRPMLIFAAARRQQNWARWFFAVLVAADAVVIPAASFLSSDLFIWTDFAFTVLSFAAEVAAVYFAFSRESAPWFGHAGPDLAVARP